MACIGRVRGLTCVVGGQALLHVGAQPSVELIRIVGALKDVNVVQTGLLRAPRFGGQPPQLMFRLACQPKL